MKKKAKRIEKVSVYRELNLWTRNGRHVLRVRNAPVHFTILDSAPLFRASVQQLFISTQYLCFAQFLIIFFFLLFLPLQFFLLQIIRVAFNFISFYASVAYYSASIISYTTCFNSTHLKSPIILLLLFLVFILKVIVYRFHAMIKFNILINFIHIARLWNCVRLINCFFFVHSVCAKLSIHIIFIILIPFKFKAKILFIHFPSLFLLFISSLLDVMIRFHFFSSFTQLWLLKHYSFALHSCATVYHLVVGRPRRWVLEEDISSCIIIIVDDEDDDVVYKTHHRCVCLMVFNLKPLVVAVVFFFATQDNAFMLHDIKIQNKFNFGIVKSL